MCAAKAPLQEGKPTTLVYHNPSDFFYLRACHFGREEDLPNTSHVEFYFFMLFVITFRGHI